MTKKIAIGFDHSHNNKLTVENNAFTDFIQYLFHSDFKLGKITAGIDAKKLSPYDLFIIGVPTLTKLDPDEITDIVNYVKKGGSLLVINDEGGDYRNKNNLSELTKHFDITFNPDQLFDNKFFSMDNSHPVIRDFKSHFITRDISEIIHSNGCTINIERHVEDDNFDAQSIAFSSNTTSWHRILDGDAWIDESKQNLAIIGTVHFNSGKVVAIGSLSIFSSLNESYGIRAVDNYNFIVNIISWLLNKSTSNEEQGVKPIYLTVPIDQDIFYWIKNMIREGRWSSVEEVINHALKNTKNDLKKKTNDIEP